MTFEFVPVTAPTLALEKLATAAFIEFRSNRESQSVLITISLEVSEYAMLRAIAKPALFGSFISFSLGNSIELKNEEIISPFIGKLTSVHSKKIVVENITGFHEFSFDKIEKSFLKIEIN